METSEAEKEGVGRSKPLTVDEAVRLSVAAEGGRVFVSCDWFEGFRKPIRVNGAWSVRAKGFTYALSSPTLRGSDVTFDLC